MLIRVANSEDPDQTASSEAANRSCLHNRALAKSTIFQKWAYFSVFLGLTNAMQKLKCLVQGNYTVPLMSL